MRRADIEVPNSPVAVSARGLLAFYPRGSFYPLINSRSIPNCWVTRSDFRLCSSCSSRSQAPLCPYTRRAISNRTEGTFEHLRYLLGGDRPSQTTHQVLSRDPIRATVRVPRYRGWYSKVASTGARAPASVAPTYPLHEIQRSNTRLQ